MLLDYHIHTDMSDGKRAHQEYVDEAVKRGLDELGFSDHFMFKDRPWVMSQEELPVYVGRIESLRDEYDIPIRTGLEIDYIEADVGKTDAMLKQLRPDLDYAIGSVHHLDGWDITHRAQSYKWKEADVEPTYDKYYRLLRGLADSGLFDIVGHFDVAKRFGYLTSKDPAETLAETVDAVRRSGMCVEINTSGIDHRCAEMYPARRILEMLYEADVEITLGSDAHHPDQVGQSFDAAVELAKDVGYGSVTRFEKRKREQVEMG